MARLSDSYNFLSSSCCIPQKPSNTVMSAGSSNFCTSVSGITSSVSLESTGLMQYAFILSKSLSEIFPSRTYVVAERITGSSLSLRSFTHCSAESALWSNCPGRYSTENTFPEPAPGNVSSYKSSTGGSAKTVLAADL